MADDFNKALKAYMSLSDTGSKAAELSAKVNALVTVCLEKLNKFVNLNEEPRPAIVENYKPEGFKPRANKTASQDSKQEDKKS